VSTGGFELGTGGIDLLTSFFSKFLGFSYGGLFLVNNIFGSVGLMYFAAAIWEVSRSSSKLLRYISCAVIFLPSVSFWSSAIGKDSLTFLAAGLICWGILNVGRRYTAILISVALLMLARPHIAGILLVALALASLLLSRKGLASRFMLSILLVPACTFGIIFGLNYAGLGDVSSFSDVGSYIEERQAQNLGGGTSVDMTSMSTPMQVFSYLFRPLPLEIGGMFGLISGLENSLLLVLFLYFVRSFTYGHSTIPAPARATLFLFSCISLLVLALTTANLGIALRQKWMFMPMLLLLGFSYLPQGAYARYQEHVRHLQHRRVRHIP
jgi:hypothetical protein